MARQRYATTHYETAERKKEAVNGTLYIEFHNGLKWYVVTWYEEDAEHSGFCRGFCSDGKE